MNRSIREIHTAMHADIDELVTYRAFPSHSLLVETLEPFILLNHHGPQTYPPQNPGLPFTPHPHRGFETVTFILSGDILHEDSGKHRSIIGPGGVQWMTAGSGVVHSELSSDEFKSQGGKIEILQLWINLPAKLKMTRPSYLGLQQEKIPIELSDHNRVALHAVSGEWGNIQGPFPSLTHVNLCWIEFKLGGIFSTRISSSRIPLLYIIHGKVKINGKEATERNVVHFDEDGDEVHVEALAESVILLGHALPNREPIATYGPFVMNTTEEIHQAIHDFRNGKFS